MAVEASAPKTMIEVKELSQAAQRILAWSRLDWRCSGILEENQGLATTFRTASIENSRNASITVQLSIIHGFVLSVKLASWQTQLMLMEAYPALPTQGERRSS
jgi:hypothetical protein